MAKILISGNINYGEIGKSAFKDSLGNQLYVGDTVITINNKKEYISENVIVENDGEFFAMGYQTGTLNGIFGDVNVYRSFPYFELNKAVLSHIGWSSFKIKENTKKEMTISEIEEELGYEIKIVKEEE